MEYTQKYQEQGYLHITDLFTTSEKQDIINAVTEIASWPETPGKWMRYYEPHRITQEKILCRIENFIPYSPVLQKYLTDGKIMDILEKIHAEPVLLYKDKINFKLPGANGFAAHQDSPAFTSQGQKHHITALIAIDPMTIENGCLDIAINRKNIWQNCEVLQHTTKGAILPEICDTLDWKPVPMQPGDVLIFGSYIPHRSGPNLTNASRRALYVTYNSQSEGDKHEQYYRDKRRAFPPECERNPGTDYGEGAKIYNFGNPIFD